MTGTPEALAASPDPGRELRTALEHLRLEGAIFLRGDYTECWSFESPPPAELAAALGAPGKGILLFHIVATGTCWVSVPDGERHWAGPGDVVVIPYGDQHLMGGSEPSSSVPLASLIDPPPWAYLPTVRHGAGGARTEVVCGFLVSDDLLFDPRRRAFPPVFVVHPPPAAAAWVEASIAYALEQSVPGSPEPTVAARRLPELVLIEVLRMHLASAPISGGGWVTAVRDPVLGPAMALLHRDPGRRWTVPDLASGVSVSRSLLDERFRRVLGRSPMRYLAEWRMHVAEDLLATTDAGVAAVARRVGYDSEEAFSRAFKRYHGLAPGGWRASRTRNNRPR